MNTTSTIQVSSEIGTLKRVIIHRPDQGIGRVSPGDAERLLFDDIVDLPVMQQEHDVFTSVLEAFVGEGNVLEVQELLLEAIEANPESRSIIIPEIIALADLPDNYNAILEKLSNEDLADVLVTGYLEDEDLVIFDPIPNFIFTRDIAVTINDHLLITKACKEARARENFITRFVAYHHPIFANLVKENKIIDLNIINDFPPSRGGQPVAVEGGDLMVIDKDHLLIGCSERTNAHTIEQLKKVLFSKGIVKNVVQINIPANRSYMHIDTIFTHIDKNVVIGFKPIIMDGIGSTVVVHHDTGKQSHYPSVKAFFLGEINKDIQFIPVGGGVSPHQEREQWTDGCNMVTVKAGVAINYDRNPKTEDALKAVGYKMIDAFDFIEGIEDGSIVATAVEKTIINIPSGELSRGRGGSRCMTCPIERI